MLDYADRINKVNDEQLLDDLKKVAKELSIDKLTISQYDYYGKFDSSTIMRHFGGWNVALQKAGLNVSCKQYSIQELYDNLANIWLKLGKQPSRRDLLRLGSPISYKAYERRFGKWSIALKSFVNYYNSSDDTTLQDNEFRNCTSTHRTSRDINLRLRFLVMQRDNFKCCLCGASPAKDPSVELNIDHIVPYSKGGETVLENLQTLCSRCNLGKSDLI